MHISFNLINGLSFGLEYVSADDELEFPCIIFDFAIFRWVIEILR